MASNSSRTNDLVAGLLGAIGCSALFAGLWWVYPPVALVVGGLVCVGAANRLVNTP